MIKITNFIEKVSSAIKIINTKKVIKIINTKKVMPVFSPSKRYCEKECIFLKPNEEEQSSKKESHYCSLFNSKLYHGGFHTHICKCEKCFALID